MVNIIQLNAEEREIYTNRELAVTLYMQDTANLNEIKNQTGIDSKELREFVRRCLEYDSGSQTIWGFRALIPRKRTSEYTRKAALESNSKSNKNTKLNGAFTALLRRFPEIEEKIINAYLRRKESKVRRPALTGEDLHRYFLKLCEDNGIELHQYPFNTEDKAYRSMYRFFNKIEKSHFTETAKLYGEESARQAKWRGNKSDTEDLLLRKPYQRVQFDGHKIDAIFTITFTTPEGDTITEVIDRIWLLVIVDVATRAILGHHLCVNKEYNLDDVLHCVRNSVVPYKKISFTIPGIDYHKDGGIPSSVIPQAEWALWEEFSMDNGRANIAKLVKDRLQRIVGCTVNYGPVNTPELRGIIERLFRTLEGMGYRKLLSTTGSNPSDPIRNNPEEHAKKYDISLNDLEELTHVLISDYNGIPHSGIRNFTPLKLMRQRIEKGMEPRILEPNQRKEAAFFSLQTKRTVAGDIKKGKRPFIYYEGVPYRNDILTNSAHLIGTDLTLIVNIDDIRMIQAFLPDGSEFGYLMAYGIWGVTPHSLRTRKAINKLKKDRKIFFNSYQNPFQIYHEYIASKAKSVKSMRNKLAQLQRDLQSEEGFEESIHLDNEEDTQQIDDSTPHWHSIEKTDQDDENTDNRPFRTYNF
ncbi:Integrase core domain protein [compost metagenome]